MAYKVNKPISTKQMALMKQGKDKSLARARAYLFGENIDIVRHNYSWKIDEQGKSKFTLGNLTDAGWFWDGNEDDAVGFFARINRSKVQNEFIKDVENIDFNEIKPIL